MAKNTTRRMSKKLRLIGGSEDEFQLFLDINDDSKKDQPIEDGFRLKCLYYVFNKIENLYPYDTILYNAVNLELENNKTINNINTEYNISMLDLTLVDKFALCTINDMYEDCIKWNKNEILYSLNLAEQYNRNIVFHTKNSLIEDIKMLCLLYITGGSNMEDILNNIGYPFYDLIIYLLNKYNLTGETQDNLNNMYTLDCVSKLFPHICCEFFSLKIIESPLSHDVLNVMLNDKQTVILCPLFPRVATRYLFQKGNNIAPQLLWIAVQLTKLNHLTVKTDEEKKRRFGNSLEELLLFNHSDEFLTSDIYDINSQYQHFFTEDKDIFYLWMIIKKSITLSPIPEFVKIHKCLKWNLITKSANPHNLWKLSREPSLQYLDEAYSHLKIWDHIRQDIETFHLPL